MDTAIFLFHSILLEDDGVVEQANSIFTLIMVGECLALIHSSLHCTTSYMMHCLTLMTGEMLACCVYIHYNPHPRSKAITACCQHSGPVTAAQETRDTGTVYQQLQHRVQLPKAALQSEIRHSVSLHITN